MEFFALASGSSGNCFYIENNDKAILVDAGISAKQIVERLDIKGKSPEKIKAIFITHEHSDHVKGTDVFSRKFNVPIFATRKTISNGFLCSDSDLINPIKNNEVIDLGGMKVEAFSKSHNASDPVSYNIFNGKRISIITDIGYACENVIANVENSDVLFLESNYDELMLDEGFYPYHLKKWIKSDTGHLSNNHSAACILEHSKSKLKFLILSHISKNNNSYEQAFSTFRVLKERRDLFPHVLVSPREIPTPLMRI